MAIKKPDPEATFAVDEADDLAPRQRGKKNKGDDARDDLKAVLALPEGRRFIRRVLEKTAPFSSSFSADGMAMAFREGHRNVGLILVAMLAEADPVVLAGLLVDVQGR
jgi:hypothetical protein